jgi:hypothetical protein
LVQRNKVYTIGTTRSPFIEGFTRPVNRAEQDPVAERLLPDDAADLLEAPPGHRRLQHAIGLGPAGDHQHRAEGEGKHDATPARPTR